MATSKAVGTSQPTNEVVIPPDERRSLRPLSPEQRDRLKHFLEEEEPIDLGHPISLDDVNKTIRRLRGDHD